MTRAHRRIPDDQLRGTDVEERGVDADASALLEADRLATAARSISRWLFRGVEHGLQSISNGNRLDSLVLARTEAGAGDQVEESRADVEHSGEVERASLGAPISLVVAAAAAFRLRHLTRKWWRRSSNNSAASKSTQPPLWRGPRFMVPPSRRMSRPRTSHRV